MRSIETASQSLAVLASTPGEIRCSPAKQQQARAQLRVMQKRGEIAYAYGAHIDKATGEYVVSYVRIREPRSRAPLYVAAVTVPMATVAGIGIMLWHARYVILAAVGIVAGVLFLAGLANLLRGHRVTCPGLHCEGCRG